MGIRETMNRYPTQVTIGAALLLVASVAFGAYYANRPSGPRPVGEGLAYFSNDDGKTWFADAASKPSPFDKDGRPAYRVYVWRCSGGKPFVSHLQRALTNTVPTDDTGGRGAPAPTAARRTPPPLAGAIVEVKRPGDAGWVLATSVEGDAIAQPRCPDGSTVGLEPVEP
jgi:hypothetical protein